MKISIINLSNLMKFSCMAICLIFTLVGCVGTQARRQVDSQDDSQVKSQVDSQVRYFDSVSDDEQKGYVDFYDKYCSRRVSIWYDIFIIENGKKRKIDKWTAKNEKEMHKNFMSSKYILKLACS